MPRRTFGSLNVAFTATTGALSASVQKSEADFRRFDKAVSRSERAAARARKAFRGMAVAVGTTIVTGLAAATREAAGFQKQLAEIRTISGATPQGIRQLGSELLELSTVVPQNLEDLTRGYYQALSSGAQAGAEALALLEASGKAATAGLTTTEVAVDVVTTAINAFSLETSDAESLFDRFLRTVDLGKLRFESLNNVFAQTAGAANTAQVSIDELLASTAVLTSVGVTPEQAATQARRALERISQRFPDLAGGAGGLLGGLQREFRGATAADLQEALGSSEAISFVRTLLSNADKFTEFIDSISDSAGKLDESFRIMGETLDQQFQLALAEFRKSMVELGTAVIPFLTDVLQRISPAVSTVARGLGATAARDQAREALSRGDFARARALALPLTEDRGFFGNFGVSRNLRAQAQAIVDFADRLLRPDALPELVVSVKKAATEIDDTANRIGRTDFSSIPGVSIPVPGETVSPLSALSPLPVPRGDTGQQVFQAQLDRYNTLVRELQEAGRANLDRVFERAARAAGRFFDVALDGARTFTDALRVIASEIIALSFDQLALFLSDQPSLFGGPPTPQFQSGGLARGGFAIVGEAGPEIVDFATPGRVYSTDQLRDALAGAGSGGNVIFAPTINGGDREGVERALAEAFPVFRDAIATDVAQQLGRRSALRRTALGA